VKSAYSTVARKLDNNYYGMAGMDLL